MICVKILAVLLILIESQAFGSPFLGLNWFGGNGASGNTAVGGDGDTVIASIQGGSAPDDAIIGHKDRTVLTSKDGSVSRKSEKQSSDAESSTTSKTSGRKGHRTATSEHANLLFVSPSR